MKNITVSVDEKVLAAVRQHAAAHSTSVNQIGDVINNGGL